MLKDSFSECLEVVLQHEGGYVNDPADNGGETIYGISRRAHPNWGGWSYVDKAKPMKTNAKLPTVLALVSTLYRKEYWERCNCDEIAKYNQTLALHVFDFAVNAGVDRGAKTLQACLGVKEDGKIGPITLAKMRESDPAVIVLGYKTRREEFYTGLSKQPKQKKFLKAWLARVNGCNDAFCSVA